MSRVLVTGAYGFVGRQVTATLLAAGHDVTIVTRHSNENTANVRVLQVEDLFTADDKTLRFLVDGIEILIHVAWYAEAGKYQSSPKNLDCVAGSIRLAKIAMEAGLKRFVGVGTCYEYDFSTIDDERPVLLPNSPLAPTTLYGSAKAATFMTLNKAMENSGTSFAWCRLFYLYGDGEDERRLLPYVLNSLRVGEPAELSEGTQVRDFLDVARAGAQIARVAEAAVTGPVNICSGQAITVRDFILSQVPKGTDTGLLQFGAKQMRPDEPETVVGKPGGLAERGWEAYQ